jgi:hypothetical protein
MRTESIHLLSTWRWFLHLDKTAKNAFRHTHQKALLFDEFDIESVTLRVVMNHNSCLPVHGTRLHEIWMMSLACKAKASNKRA